MTQAAFARELGVHRALITRLKHAGRLVLRDGLVVVDESRARIQATGGLRHDVADRWARDRAAKAATPTDTSLPPQAPIAVTSLEEFRDMRAAAETRRLRAQADREEMERDKMAGSLIALAEAEHAARSIGAAVGAELDVLADQLAPLAVGITQLDAAHEVIAEHARNMRTRIREAIARERERLTKKDGG